MLLVASLAIGIQVWFNHQGIGKEEIVHYLSVKKVEQERTTVLKYAKQYEVEDHTDVLLAMMYQESKGRGRDPMQASESYCGEIGCINDRETSIEQGVAYFAKALQKADGDVPLAIQAYNFGVGFITYVKEKEMDYTIFAAIQFSKEMYEQANDPSDYSCLRKEGKKYNACYGDIYYVRDVLKHKKNF